MEILILIAVLGLIGQINSLKERSLHPPSVPGSAAGAAAGKNLRRVVIGKSSLVGTTVWMEGDDAAIVMGLLAIKIQPKDIYIL